MKTREELIQDYLENQLTAEDQVQFDELLQEDTNFKQELEDQQYIFNVLNKRLNADEIGLRATLQSTRQKLGEEKSKLVNFKKWLIPIATAACLLIVGKFILWPSAYYQLPTMQSEIVRGNEDPALMTYENAVEAFNHKDFEKSAEILNTLITQQPEILQYQYYYALSLLGKKDFDKASEKLIPIADGESIFKYDATYYLAVAYIELNQFERAKNRINEIPDETKIYQDAQKLLKKLD